MSFSGSDTEVTPPLPGINGTAGDGAPYYLVKVIGGRDEIEGCYEKTNFHREHRDNPGHRYAVYSQNNGPFYLKINSGALAAPWFFGTNDINIKYT